MSEISQKIDSVEPCLFVEPYRVKTGFNRVFRRKCDYKYGS